MGKFLLSPDGTSIRRTLHIDGDQVIIESHAPNLWAELELNKAMYNHDDGYSPDRGERRVAHIPAIVLEQWLKEGLDFNDPNNLPAIVRKLNDPENRFLRTAPGQLEYKNGRMR